MNRILLSASSFALLAGSLGSSGEPKFAVEEKSTLAKAFESNVKLESTSIKIFLEGQDEPIDGHGDVQVSIENASRLEVTDEYVAMGKGRPKKLKRTFDKIEETKHQKVKTPSGDDENGDGDHKKSEESELAGKSVVFTWNEDSSSYAASFPEGKGDESLLEDLVEDMDFRFLLPKGKVSDGDAWDVDAKACGSILAPGGDLKLKDKEEGEDSGSGVGKEIQKHLEGKAKATWKGIREEDGKKLGVIALDAKLTSEGETSASKAHELAMKFKVSLEIEGEVTWDLEAGHFHAFKAAGKVQYSTSTTRSIKLGEESKELRQEVDLEGEATYAASLR